MATITRVSGCRERVCWCHDPSATHPIGTCSHCGCRWARTPSLATLMRWEADGVAKATDGCRVETDGVCPHGCKSWLVVLGYI